MQVGWQGLLGQVPVFVSTREVLFYMGDPRKHTNTITVLNPYAFDIYYQVLSTITGDEKYSVVEPKGIIKPKHRSDFMIRHNAPYQANCGVTDLFKIKIYDGTTRQFLGKITISATLQQGLPPLTEDSTITSKSFRVEKSSNCEYDHSIKPEVEQNIRRSQNPNNPLILSLGLVCFCAVLFFHTDKDSCLGDSSTQYTLSDRTKYICTFILGMVTLVIFRP